MAKKPKARYLPLIMNQHQRLQRPATLAEIEYLDGDMRVLKPGSHVLCAVTGEKIPLDELRYWSADRQEAYRGPEEVLKRLEELDLLPKV